MQLLSRTKKGLRRVAFVALLFSAITFAVPINPEVDSESVSIDIPLNAKSSKRPLTVLYLPTERLISSQLGVMLELFMLNVCHCADLWFKPKSEEDRQSLQKVCGGTEGDRIAIPSRQRAGILVFAPGRPVPSSSPSLAKSSKVEMASEKGFDEKTLS
ncbi:hypothetical protein EV360DRAFT_87874 [Lentinula raphanica]|nr:hypothetical protein EV360DRAFT_87874 [Lentinula raphanica]